MILLIFSISIHPFVHIKCIPHSLLCPTEFTKNTDFTSNLDILLALVFSCVEIFKMMVLWSGGLVADLHEKPDVIRFFHEKKFCRPPVESESQFSHTETYGYCIFLFMYRFLLAISKMFFYGISMGLAKCNNSCKYIFL